MTEGMSTEEGNLALYQKIGMWAMFIAVVLYTAMAMAVGYMIRYIQVIIER